MFRLDDSCVNVGDERNRVDLKHQLRRFKAIMVAAQQRFRPSILLASLTLASQLGKRCPAREEADRFLWVGLMHLHKLTLGSAGRSGCHLEKESGVPLCPVPRLQRCPLVLAADQASIMLQRLRFQPVITN